MRRIIVTEFISLDGVMEDPGGAEGTAFGGWAFKFERGAEGDKYKLDELMAADAMLLGRVTYQGFAKAWPSMTDEVGFAEKMNGMRKYVVSSTLEKAEWKNSQILRGDVADEVRKLKAQEGGDILVAGSARLAHALQDADLVDEYRLMVYPTVLGSGKRLFPDGGRAGGLELVEARQSGAVAIMTLRPSAKETRPRHDTRSARPAPAAREGSDRRPLSRAARGRGARAGVAPLARSLQPRVPAGVRRDAAPVPADAPARAGRRPAAQHRSLGGGHLHGGGPAQRRVVHDQLRPRLRPHSDGLPRRPSARRVARADPGLRDARVGRPRSSSFREDRAAAAG